MPLIKPETRKPINVFLSSQKGEALILLFSGGAFWSIWIYITGGIIRYVSGLIYPFTYIILPLPLDEYLPQLMISPSLGVSFFFGALLAFYIYRFEKNVFFRRIHILLRALFAAIAASAFVFICSVAVILLSDSGIAQIVSFFPKAAPIELPALLILLYLYSFPLISLCDLIRRRIFILP